MTEDAQPEPPADSSHSLKGRRAGDRRDGFLPRVFQFRGDRLAFSYGIVVLAVIASLLIWYFEGSVTNLIPLYTVGVFVALTLSQSGMVRRWRRLRNEVPGWRRRAVINGIGAITTGIVAVEVAVAKLAADREI